MLIAKVEIDAWAKGYREDNKGVQICAWGWAQVEIEIQGVSSFLSKGRKAPYQGNDGVGQEASFLS